MHWENIIVHHSASNWGNALAINEWHKSNGWAGIGYHFVICNGCVSNEDYENGWPFYFLDGSIECGRNIDGDQWVEQNEIGAHALGFNKDSIGICLIHLDSGYSTSMLKSLVKLCNELSDKFNIEIDNIRGHYEVDSNKPLCPGIDMNFFRYVLKNNLTYA